MDPEEGKMKIEFLTSMIELAENNKKIDKPSYIESLKDSWSTHQEWKEQCTEDLDLGNSK